MMLIYIVFIIALESVEEMILLDMFNITWFDIIVIKKDIDSNFPMRVFSIKSLHFSLVFVKEKKLYKKIKKIEKKY